MKKPMLFITGTALVVGLGLSGGAIAVASGGDSDANITGPTADRAIEAALLETGGGTANSVELDTENGATWEVEVTRPDGTTVDVRLDDKYSVVVVEGDHDRGNDRSGR